MNRTRTADELLAAYDAAPAGSTLALNPAELELLVAALARRDQLHEWDEILDAWTNSHLAGDPALPPAARVLTVFAADVVPRVCVTIDGKPQIYLSRREDYLPKEAA